MSSGMFSLGEWMALLSSPKPISTVFMPNMRSKSLMIGMLPPRRTARGFLPRLLKALFGCLICRHVYRAHVALAAVHGRNLHLYVVGRNAVDVVYKQL